MAMGADIMMADIMDMDTDVDAIVTTMEVITIHPKECLLNMATPLAIPAILAVLAIK